MKGSNNFLPPAAATIRLETAGNGDFDNRFALPASGGSGSEFAVPRSGEHWGCLSD